MASDWLKMEYDLAEKPEVIAMSGILKVEADLIVGKLHRVWSWFARHTADGNAVGVTRTFIDVRAGRKGFADAMSKVGWMTVCKGGISVPNFDRHMSKSAKARALGAERAQRFRNDSTVTEALPVESGVSLTLTHRHSDTWALPLDFDWEAIRADCNRLLGTVTPRSQQDRDLLVKAVVLSRTVFDAEWLWTAATAAKRKKSHEQFRYLHGALRGKSKDRGENFNLLLKRIEIPVSFRQSQNGVAAQ